MRAKFSQERYDRYDGPAKEKAKIFLNAVKPDYRITIPEENFKEDLLAQVGPVKVNVQVEVKLGWSGIDFPFKNIHIPKSKIDNARKSHRYVWIIVFNKELTSLAFIEITLLKGLTEIRKKNKFSLDKEEPFYEFDLSEIDFYTEG